MDRELDVVAGAVGALEDDTRRQMYLYIRNRGLPVSRDEAAREVGISRKLAAFHLDKLVDKGLLTAHYARPVGKGGPGAGRPAKVYEPSSLELVASIPERRYDLAGQILVDAAETQTQGESPRDAARRVAREAGLGLGEETSRTRGVRRPGPERTLSVTADVLRGHGFEPYEEEEGVVALRNCPFHALAQRSPQLVCGLNQAFIDGILRGLGNQTVEAVLDPFPGRCCVKLRSCAGMDTKQGVNGSGDKEERN
jgi:predicted ArsR family transcriptional regulator